MHVNAMDYGLLLLSTSLSVTTSGTAVNCVELIPAWAEFSIKSRSFGSVVHCQQASSHIRLSIKLKKCRWRMELVETRYFEGEKLCSHLSQTFSYWVTAASRISFSSEYGSALFLTSSLPEIHSHSEPLQFASIGTALTALHHLSLIINI